MIPHDSPLIPWALGLLSTVVIALVTWVWKIEGRVTQQETVMFGVQNSSSVVATLTKVSAQLDDHARLIGGLVKEFELLQREHERGRRSE